MEAIKFLLDKAQEACSPANNNGLAAALGVKPSAVSNWRHGRAYPDAVSCARIAELVNAPLPRILGIVGEARAISREEKSVWRKLAASAMAAFVLLGATTLPGIGARDAHAQDGAAFRVTQASSAYYVSRRGILTVIGDVLRWLRWKFSGKVAGPHIEAFTA